MKKLISIILVSIVFCTMFIEVVLPVDAATVSVKYSVHLQNDGWQKEKSNGETAGTTGKSKRIEAIKIKVSG
jgi:uncharacterized protein YjdB